MKKKPEFQFLKAWKRLVLLLALIFSSHSFFAQNDAMAISQSDGVLFSPQSEDQKSGDYDIKLNINFKEIGVKDLLKELENQSEFSFVYDKSILSYTKKFNLNENNIDLLDLLDIISNQSSLRFKPVHNIINVRLANSTSRDMENPVQEDVNVEGKVVAQDGMPVPGASIVAQGTDIGTVTDFDGNYSITVPVGSSLVFHYIGMKTQIVPIGSRTTINVTMVEDVSAL